VNALSVEEGFRTLIVNVPVVLPAGIDSAEQDTPGVPEPQVTVTAEVWTALRVIVEVPLEVEPEAPAVVLTVAVVLLTVKEAAMTVRVGGAGLRSGPPPGCGLKVSTEMVPGVAILLAGT